jgi:AraC family transcriptional regulator
MAKTDTHEDYKRRIAKVFDAILANPAAPHSVESLAQIANLSPFHFHRIYRAMTGEGLAETVRRLRLAQAALQLTTSDLAITHVALDAGYDSPQAFARAFRDFSGVSPSAFQDRQTSICEVDITYVSLVPRWVLAKRHDASIASIGQAYRQFYGLLGKLNLSTSIGSQIGHSFGDPDDPDSFTYWTGVELGAPIEAPDGFEVVLLEGGAYACCRLVGPFALIGPTFKALFGGWLPRSGHEADDKPVLEIYRNPTIDDPRRDPVIDLMIPIKGLNL